MEILIVHQPFMRSFKGISTAKLFRVWTDVTGDHAELESHINHLWILIQPFLMITAYTPTKEFPSNFNHVLPYFFPKHIIDNSHILVINHQKNN